MPWESTNHNLEYLRKLKHLNNLKKRGLPHQEAEKKLREFRDRHYTDDRKKDVDNATQ